MSKFTSELIDDYAEKLIIGLKPEENEMVKREFDIIEANMELITKIPGIESIEPMTHALDDFEFILREDVAEESIPLDDLLANCDDTEDGEVSVPKVVG